MARKRPNKGTKARDQWDARTRRNRRHAIWSGRVRRRDGHRCVVCGATVTVKLGREGKPKIGKKSGRVLRTTLHAHHLLPKETYLQFRFKVQNGVTLCPTHHKYGPRSAHRNPFWFVAWLRSHRPHQYRWVKDRLAEEDAMLPIPMITDVTSPNTED